MSDLDPIFSPAEPDLDQRKKVSESSPLAGVHNGSGTIKDEDLTRQHCQLVKYKSCTLFSRKPSDIRW